MRNVAVTYLGIVRDTPDKEVAGLIKALGDPEAPVRQAAGSHVDRVIGRRRATPQHPHSWAQALERSDHPAHARASLAGDDHVGERLVDGLALAVQGVELRALAGQRPVAARHALPRGGRIDVDPDDAMLPQRLPHPTRGHGAAAEGQHLAAGSPEQLQRQLLLGLAKRLLPVLGEALRDLLAEPGLQLVVDVEDIRVQRACGTAGSRALPGAHEPDEDDVAVLVHRVVARQPIRCW